MRAEQHQQAADHLDGVGHQHHLALWETISERPHKRRQHDVEKGEQGYQRRPLPFWGAVISEQLNSSNE